MKDNWPSGNLGIRVVMRQEGRSQWRRKEQERRSADQTLWDEEAQEDQSVQS